MNQPARRGPRVISTVFALIASVLTLTACDMTPGEATDLLTDVMTMVGEPTNTVPMPGGIQTQPPNDNGGSGENEEWAVYFTNPVIPFDDVTAGGIEENFIWLANNAQSTLDVAMFEFDLENVAQALIAAHNRGVQVRVVYDDEYAEEDPEISTIIAAGIPATPDERGAYQHNKFAIFDGEIVWTGSMNFTENGVYRNNNNVVAFVSPQLAANYTTEFEEMFSGAFGPSSPSNTPYPGTQVGDVWVETYFSPEDDVLAQLLSLVGEAQQSIHFMAFSFTQDDLGDLMMAKVAEGVEVTGLFESRGANTVYSECQRFLDFGLDVRLDGNPRIMHNKVIIIDGQIVATGSFNFSENASNSNDENMVFIHSPEIASYYEAEFIRLVSMGEMPVGGECSAGD